LAISGTVAACLAEGRTRRISRRYGKHPGALRLPGLRCLRSCSPLLRGFNRVRTQVSAPTVSPPTVFARRCNGLRADPIRGVHAGGQVLARRGLGVSPPSSPCGDGGLEVRARRGPGLPTQVPPPGGGGGEVRARRSRGPHAPADTCVSGRDEVRAQAPWGDCAGMWRYVRGPLGVGAASGRRTPRDFLRGVSAAHCAKRRERTSAASIRPKRLPPPQPGRHIRHRWLRRDSVQCPSVIAPYGVCAHCRNFAATNAEKLGCLSHALRRLPFCRRNTSPLMQSRTYGHPSSSSPIQTRCAGHWLLSR
jgi:hypothetical protein